MKINKIIATQNALNLGKESIRSCTKQTMANIVMPSLSERGLMAYVFPGMVITKEQPEGCRYGAMSHTVLRIIGGQLLKGGMADAYSWDAATYAKKAAKTVPIGFGLGATVDSVKWAMEIVQTVVDPVERELLIQFFIEQPSLRLVFSPKEERKCIEVTQDLYDAGLTSIVDEWMPADENGLAEETILKVGDFLIVTDDGVYCIRRDEFLETHTLG